METLLFYFLKVILCSAVMFLYYRIFLKDKTFHHYNRFYLLGTLGVSLLLPLLKVDYFTINVNQNIYELLLLLQNNSTSNISANDFSIYPIIFAILALVAVFFVAKFGFALWKINQFKKEYPEEKLEGISFYMTNLENAPFSFFRNLFWKNSILLQSDLGKQILKHEMVHIEQKHSYDKMFIEILTAVFWFNPIFYLIKKELNLIHEYLADKKALKNSDTKAFAQMLLETHFSGNILPGTSPFLNSNLKKRIIMLKKSNTKFAYFRKVFALPLLFCLVFVYMVKAENREIRKQNLEIEELTKSINSDVSPLMKQDTISENTNLKYKANDQFVFEGKAVDQDTFEEKKSQFSQNKLYYFTAYSNFLSKDLPVIYVGGKNSDLKNDDLFVGKIVAKVWDTPPAEKNSNTVNPNSISAENADERAIFLINSEMVTKAQFLNYKKESNGKNVLDFSNGLQNDKDHWVFGEREQYGVFQISEMDKMGGENANKFHQLVKKINPKWYFEQYINQKYTKRENERKKKLGLEENTATVTVIKSSENIKNDKSAKLFDNETDASKDKMIRELMKNDNRIEIEYDSKTGKPKYFYDGKEVKSVYMSAKTVQDNDSKVGDVRVLSSENKNYYLDGKKITLIELNKLDIKSIKSLKVEKNGDMYILSKKPDEPSVENPWIIGVKAIAPPQKVSKTENSGYYSGTSVWIDNGNSKKEISDLTEEELLKLKIYVNAKETDWKTLKEQNPKLIKQLLEKHNNKNDVDKMK